MIEGSAGLTAPASEFVLRHLASGSEILRVEVLPTRRGRARPCLVVTRCEGQEASVVLRTGQYWPGIYREAQVLPHLREIGLPVPEILGGPEEIDGVPYSLSSRLPGSPLHRSGIERGRQVELLVGAIRRLHGCSDSLRHLDIPRMGLTELLFEVEAQCDPKRDHPLFTKACRRLRTTLARVQDPLVFSNGDYLAGNFLTDGEEVTGYLDFEYVAFQDPLYGLAKVELYPPTETALPMRDAYLEAHGATVSDLAPRLALRCCFIMRFHLAIEEDTPYRAWILEKLETSLQGC